MIDISCTDLELAKSKISENTNQLTALYKLLEGDQTSDDYMAIMDEVNFLQTEIKDLVKIVYND